MTTHGSKLERREYMYVSSQGNSNVDIIFVFYVTKHTDNNKWKVKGHPDEVVFPIHPIPL